MIDNTLKKVLLSFGIQNADEIHQIYKSVWNIDNEYILKKNNNVAEIEKSYALCELLRSESIPVSHFILLDTGKPYIREDESYYCLMEKIKGHQINPFLGNGRKNGRLLGHNIAQLHKVLKKVEIGFECRDADCISELQGWIMKEIKTKSLNINPAIIEECLDFETLYRSLPRQLIHRDMHTGNMLFKDGAFAGFLDFDISQKNVRIFDLCYLGVSMLAGMHESKADFKKWQDIFNGVLEGYNAILPLDDNEKEAIPMMFVMIELIFSAFFSTIGRQDVSNDCCNTTYWLLNNRHLIPKI